MGPEPSPEDSARHFAADGLLMIGANGLAALLYLLVHMVLGRQMAGIDYAALVALLGLLNLLGIGAAAIQTTLARYTALAAESGDTSTWLNLIRRAARRVAMSLAPICTLWVLASPWLRDVLRAPSAWALVLLAATAALQLFQPLIQGALQGLRRFQTIALSSVAGAATRLFVAVAIVALGGGVSAVLGAFVLGALVALAVCCWPVRHFLLDKEAPSTPKLETVPIYRFLGLALVGQGALFGLMNADLILAPRLLEGDTLAAYSKAAMLARTVIFLPLPLVIAMFPRAVVSGRKRILGGTMLTAAALAALPAMWVAIQPGLFLSLMYGDVEPAAAGLLRHYVWAMLPLLLVEIVVPYLWARRQPWAVVALAIPMLAYLGQLLRANGQPEAMIKAVAGAGLVFLVWLLVPAIRGSRDDSDRLSPGRVLG